MLHVRLSHSHLSTHLQCDLDVAPQEREQRPARRAMLALWVTVNGAARARNPPLGWHGRWQAVLSVLHVRLSLSYVSTHLPCDLGRGAEVPSPRELCRTVSRKTLREDAQHLGTIGMSAVRAFRLSKCKVRTMVVV